MDMRTNPRFIRNDALGGEPVLRDVLADPIILALMARDGVSRAELHRLVATWRGKRPATDNATDGQNAPAAA